MEYEGATLGEILSQAIKNREETVTMSKASAESFAKSMARAGLKIEAVKMVRTYTGMGVGEAKAFVENGFKAPIIVGSKARYENCPDLFEVIGVMDHNEGKVYWVKNLTHPHDSPFTVADRALRLA